MAGKEILLNRWKVGIEVGMRVGMDLTSWEAQIEQKCYPVCEKFKP
jgi:hypothetical protein